MDQGGTFIIKRGGRRDSESFSPKKLHESILAIMLSSGAHVGQAEHTARRVVTEVEEWLKERPEVKSDDLRRVAGDILSRYHPDAGYLYKHHRVTL